MKVHTVTGGRRNYLELTPETVEEASALVFAAKSEFLEKDFLWLQVTPSLSPFLMLRVFLGGLRVSPAAHGAGIELDPATREAIDQTA